MSDLHRSPASGGDAELVLDARATTLVQLAAAAGAELDQLFVVGGVVRDALLERGARDLDVVATHHGARDAVPAGIALGELLLAEHGGAEIARHAFGTIKITLAGIGDLDIATARSETYAHPGALPDVAYVADIERDLVRRDVSVNALALSGASIARGARQSDIVDAGSGVSDVHARLVRVLHAGSFVDDPTRVLRVARYAASLPGFGVEPGTRDLLVSTVAAGALATVSPQRRAAELRLTWETPTVADSMQLLDDVGALAGLNLPPVVAAAFVARASLLADAGMSERDRTTLCVATIASSFPDLADAGAWLRAAELPADLVSVALAVTVLDRACDSYERVPATADGWQHRDALQVAALAAPIDVVQIVARLHPLVELAQVLDDRAALEPLLSGNDLLELGVPEGRMLGNILRALGVARRRQLVSTVDDERQLVSKLQAQLETKDEMPQ